MSLVDVSWYDPSEDEAADLRSVGELQAARRWCAEDLRRQPGEYHQGKVAALDWLLGCTSTAPATGRRYPALYGPVGWETGAADDIAHGRVEGGWERPDPQRQRFMVGVGEVLMWADLEQQQDQPDLPADPPWSIIDGRPAAGDPVV